MAAMVAPGNSQLSSSLPLQDSGHRNKRKFRMDPPLSDPCKLIQTQVGYPNYEYSMDNSVNDLNCQQHDDLCDSCNSLTCPHEDELDMDDYPDADWTDPTEAQLEDLVLMNLHMIFKSAILMISSYGYDKEIATKAVVRSGICYGCKDTVYNIVDNALALLSNGKDIDSSKDHLFENLHQLEKYVLAEMVCVLREVRPFFSTGDAMWCLLICDMNVSHACAMDVESLSGLKQELNSNTSDSSSIARQSGTKSDQSKSTQHSSQIATQTQMPPVTGIPSLPSMRFSSSSNGHFSQSSSNLSKARQHISSQSMVEEFKQACMSEEKLLNGKKGRGGSSKRESVLHHKLVHSEKSYRAYKSKGTLRAGKISNLGSLILDKKCKSSSDSTGINLKSASIKKNKSVGVEVFQGHGNTSISFGAGGSASLSFSSKTFSNQPALPTTSTELSLSISSKCKNITANPKAITDNVDRRSYSGMQKFEKMGPQWVPHDKKDEMMFILVPRVRELQAQLLEWTDWAQQKIMQAARRLNKNKSELQTLRHEKDEVFRLKKEKQTLEENTVKKLKEMENALAKATRQVEKANVSSRSLEVENGRLRLEMDAAKLRAVESAINFQEVSKREMKTLKNSHSWEREKTVFRDEIMAEKRKFSELQKQLEQPKAHLDQLEAKWRQEVEMKNEILMQADAERKQREQIESNAKSKDDVIRLEAERNLQKYKDDIQELEAHIAQLRLKTDVSKVAALVLSLSGKNHALKNTSTDFSSIPDMMLNSQEEEGLEREKECVMCLMEEISVVFLPCGHQVVCETCNKLHGKQGWKDCPSCRTLIERRISVRSSSDGDDDDDSKLS